MGAMAASLSAQLRVARPGDAEPHTPETSAGWWGPRPALQAADTEIVDGDALDSGMDARRSLRGAIVDVIESGPAPSAEPASAEKTAPSRRIMPWGSSFGARPAAKSIRECLG